MGPLIFSSIEYCQAKKPRYLDQTAGGNVIELVNGVNGLATVGLSESEEGDGTQDDGAGVDTLSLGLEELDDGLGLGSEGEGLVVLKGRLDVVVVGVEPLDHLQGGDIDTLLLETTAHGEVLVEGVELVLGVTLRDNAEELDVVKNLVWWDISEEPSGSIG